MPVLTGLRSAVGFGLSVIAQSTAIPPERSVDEWAEQERIVSRIESKYTGPWSNERFPVAREIMQACSLSDPSRIIPIRGSAQTIKSEASKNVIGYLIQDHPRGILVLLPTNDEVGKYERTKLDPMIKATPALAKRVYGTRKDAHTRKRSTVKQKDFKDGFILLTSATSSKGLQMVTVGAIIAEEVSEYPDDTGGRGHALDQAILRASQYEDERKVVIPSTPGRVGSCKITELFDKSAQGWIFWKCVHCGDHYRLRFHHLRKVDGRTVCFAPCCGAQTEQESRRIMNETAVFLYCFESENPDNAFPWARSADGEIIRDVVRAEDFDRARNRDLEGRDKGFHLWRGQAPWNSWQETYEAWEAAKDDPVKLKVFYQQFLGEPYSEAVDVPDAEKLFTMRGGAPRAKTHRIVHARVPNWAGFLTAAVDLQGNRFEWEFWAWGPGPTGAMIDRGVIAHSPKDPTGWPELLQILSREYGSNHLRPQRARRIGIDTGGSATTRAYQFVMANRDVFALKGHPGGYRAIYEPALAQSPTGGKIKGALNKILAKVPLWLVNTHALKDLVFHGLHNALMSYEENDLVPGLNLFSNDAASPDYFEQLTNEVLKVHPHKDFQEWVKTGPNEALDLAVMNLSLAKFAGLDRLSHDQWRALIEKESIDPAQAELGPLERMMLGEADPANIQRVDRHAPPAAAVSILDKIRKLNAQD